MGRARKEMMPHTVRTTTPPRTSQRFFSEKSTSPRIKLRSPLYRRKDNEPMKNEQGFGARDASRGFSIGDCESVRTRVLTCTASHYQVS
jgi:hypothetical protein